jgi:uncharacterized protein involved in outer membrane biogenesis
MRRAALRWAARALAGTLVILLLSIAAAVGTAQLIDGNHLRAPLLRFIAARLGRPVQVQGAIDADLLSMTPRLSAQRVTIGNPPWMPPGSTAEIGRLTLVLERWPLFGRQFEIRQLAIEDATLHLARDVEGRANWQASPPHTPGGGGGPPLIHSLAASDIRVELDDERRHLKFVGTLSARDLPATAGVVTWHLEGAGVLNGRAATVALNGDPLSAVRSDRPYRFAFAERSSGSHLDGRGQLPQPFDFRLLDATAQASGEDLKDLFFLIGIALPDTGRYRLSLKIERRHGHFRYSELALNSGQSDLRGSVSIETAGGRPHIDGELSSQLLRSADIGAAAAGRAPAGQAPALLLSDAALPFDGLRSGDAQLDYHAQALQIGRLSLHAVATHIAIDHGTLALAPLSATLYDGKVTGRARLDATREPAQASLALKLVDVRASALEHKTEGPSAFDAPIQARLDLTGQGRSIHQFAADSNGTVTAVVPHGELRAAFADLIGADFARGLGLLLAKDQKAAAVRCGVVSFEVQQGVMHARTLLLDTDPVLIGGEGDIHLDSEAIELTLHGQPKSRRLLRLHAPVLVRGTLSHPTIGIQGGNGAAQTAKAIAGGVARAPLEVLGFVDADLASNADCAALLQSAQQQGVPVKSSDQASPP